MNDNHFIDAGQKLIKIKEEGEDWLVETFDETSIKRVFWVKKSEVDFLEDKEEEIKQKDKEIFEDWI